jgi:hypothetical protein
MAEYAACTLKKAEMPIIKTANAACKATANHIIDTFIT